jgi:hypothetical protein
MLWARMVAYVTGTVNQELLLRNGGGVGVEVGTASRVNLTYILRMRAVWPKQRVYQA